MSVRRPMHTDVEIRLHPRPDTTCDWEVVNTKTQLTADSGNSENKGEALRDAKKAIAFAICEVIVDAVRAS